MGSEYTYDKDKVRFRKVKTSVWKWFRRGVTFVVATMSMAVLYYVIFALFFSTDTERRLKAVIDMYEREMPELERKESLLSDVVEGLKARDNRIYEEIFHTTAPDMDRLSSMDFLADLDSIPDDNIVRYAEGKLASIELSADAPMREPYTVYLQGGLTYESGKTGIMLAAEELLKK
jgi:hypothetical protein